MMTLLFRHLTEAIHKRQGLAKIAKLITLLQMMLVYDFPAVKLLQQLLDLFAFERRHATATRHAFPG